MYIPGIGSLVRSREGSQEVTGWDTTTTAGDCNLCAFRVELRSVGLVKSEKFVLDKYLIHC